jgi:type I restriction enzyme S subunit
MKQELIIKKKELPEGWRILPYEKCVAKLKLNKVKKYKVTEYLKEGKYPIIDQSKVLINGYTNIENDVMYFETPVIIFGDHTLNVKYVDFPFARGADGTQIITPNINIVVPKYFYYHLLSLNIKVKLYERYFKYVKQSFFIIPPLPEQQKIVSKLDKQMEQIEMMKKEAEREIENTREFPQSFLLRMFEDKKVETRIKKISEICMKPQYGYTASSTIERVGPRLLRITDIQKGKVLWDNVPYCLCSEEDYKKYELKHNDIVFVRTGATTGKSYIIKDPKNSIFASYLIRLRAKEEIVIPDYVYLFFQSPEYWNIISQGARGGIMPNFNANMLSTLPVPLPDKEIQERIVKKSINILKICQNQIKMSETQLNAISQLPSSILNEVFGQYEIPEEA